MRDQLVVVRGAFEDRRAALRSVLESEAVWVALEAGEEEQARERAWSVVDRSIG